LQADLQRDRAELETARGELQTVRGELETMRRRWLELSHRLDMILAES